MRREIKNNLSHPFKEKKGFTLIELAIVLVVLGILVGLGVGLVGILTKQAKLRESRDIVRDVYESIISRVSSLYLQGGATGGSCGSFDKTPPFGRGDREAG